MLGKFVKGIELVHPGQTPLMTRSWNSSCPWGLSFPTCLSHRGKHGVGRIDIVENRFIGMKSRGGSAPMPTVPLSAPHAHSAHNYLQEA